jgi:hypothetical protein
MPDKGFCVAIVVLGEVVDGGFEFFGRAVNTSAKLAFRES